MSDDRYCFADRVAVVTGGARGIGRGIAEALRKAGADVHVFDRAASVDRVGAAEDGLTFHEVDIADSASVAAATARLPKPPVLLVNNAGITRDRSLLKMSDEEWRSVLDVNLTGAFTVLRALAPGMVEAGYGRIVNVVSINGLRGKFGQANYAASKAGLVGLTKTAARELGPKGVTVNAVAPGMVLTEMTLALAPEVRQKALDEAVLTRLPEVADIAAAVLFLLSDAARCVTGEVIRVDSGQYI
ncbi:3-oxoacyl-ACP reductase FabG [Azospirillum sp.]|uniref:3-oxoacyl-ACP reductase FabG n=1 Tax=Azospirillum sp. TaxID=34012 RepID=UPI003D75FDB7